MPEQAAVAAAVGICRRVDVGGGGSRSAPATAWTDAEVLDLLTSLADKSLVVAEQHDGHSRYRLLETVRQYARDRLVDSGGRRGGAGTASGLLPGAGGGGGTETEGRGAGRMAAASGRGAREPAGCVWSGASRRQDRKQVFGFAGRCNGSGGRGDISRRAGSGVRASWKEAGAEERTPERAKVLNAAGVLAYYQGDYPAARALHEESLAIRRELGDRSGIAGSLNNLGNVALRSGRLCRRPGAARGEPGDHAGTGGSGRHRQLAEQPGDRGLRAGRLSGRPSAARGEPGDQAGTGRSARHRRRR